MSKVKNTVGMRPSSDQAFLDTTHWMQILLHEEAGETSMSWTGGGPDMPVSGSEAIAGTTADIFDNFGEFEVNAAADNGTVITSGDELTLMAQLGRTDIPGTTFIFFNYNRGVTAADGYLFSFNNKDDGANPDIGWGLKHLSASGKLQINYAGGDMQFTAANGTDTSNTPTSFGLYVHSDGTTVSSAMGTNGSQEVTDSSTKVMDGAVVRAAIFGNVTNAGSINNQCSAELRMSELIIIRTATDQRSRFAELFGAFHDSGGELTTAFDKL